MRKFAFFVLLCALFAPLNAQRMVKYITFYPIPYGSHDRLDVKNTAIISGRDGGKSEVAGRLTVPGAITLDGILRLKETGGSNVTTTGAIRSGDVNTVMAYGRADLIGPSNTVEALDNNVDYAYVAEETSVNSNVKIGSYALTNLAGGCASTPNWCPLRLKGSEECKYYLTCGSCNEASNGCDAPDLPECEFGPWQIGPANIQDTCGDSQREGCIQTHACGTENFPCTALREAVSASIPATFNCGRGDTPSAYCYTGSKQCTDANLTWFCGQHDGAKRMIINGTYYAVEICSFSNVSDATFWCRENPSKPGCILYGNAASAAGTQACYSSYTIYSSSSASCHTATANVGGYICQGGTGDTSTMYYRVCGG